MHKHENRDRNSWGRWLALMAFVFCAHANVGCESDIGGAVSGELHADAGTSSKKSASKDEAGKGGSGSKADKSSGATASKDGGAASDQDNGSAGDAARTNTGAAGEDEQAAGMSGSSAAASGGDHSAPSGSEPASAGASGSTDGSAGSAANSAADGGDDSAQGGHGDHGGHGGQGGTASKPANALDACEGNEGNYVCDGSTLYHCAAMGVYDKKDECMSADDCQVGTTSGRCGTCEPGKYTCMGDVLMSCDSTGTPVQALPACEAGLCNAMSGRCNECKPGSDPVCMGNSVATCGDDGTQMLTACSGDTPYCLKGKCVQCMGASDCKASSDCATAMCDTSSGMCTNGTPKPVHTQCSSNNGKVCDLIGNCVGCVDDTDCSPDQRCNPLDLITPCEARSPLEVEPSLPGTFTVTVAPNYTVRFTKDPALMVTILNGFAGVCQSLDNSNTCTLSASNSPRTLTITSPNATCGTDPLPGLINQDANVQLSFELPAGKSDAGTPDCSSTTHATLTLETDNSASAQKKM